MAAITGGKDKGARLFGRTTLIREGSRPRDPSLPKPRTGQVPALTQIHDAALFRGARGRAPSLKRTPAAPLLVTTSELKNRRPLVNPFPSRNRWLPGWPKIRLLRPILRAGQTVLAGCDSEWPDLSRSGYRSQ
jgi:hypothetical protein